MYVKNLTDLIGNTPLLPLERYHQEGNLLAKVEYFNPLSSAKDLAGYQMILQAEEDGLLGAGGTIVEPTSGNTGVALAYIGLLRGYDVVMTMPDTMSVERRMLLGALGATVVLTPGAAGMAGAIQRAKELVAETAGAWMPNQFANPSNGDAHYKTTGPEIWKDTAGKIDVFVAGVGTGGTITGVARYLKEQNPAIEIVAVEPASSPVLSGGDPGPHKIQGIGAGFVPEVLDMTLVDRVITVTNEEAMETVRTLGKTEGLLVGISSGAAACAAKKLANDPTMAGKLVVTLLPDTGERYLSTGVFEG